MFSENDIHNLQSATAFCKDGNKIGSVGQVYLDDQSGQPQWVTVNTGLLGTKTNFVPLEGASLDGDRLTVAYGKDVIKDAPSIDEDGHLTEQDEAELYRYYERQGGHGADVRDRDGVRDRDDLRDRGDGRARDDVHGDDLHDRERDAAWRGDDAGVRSDRNDAAAVGAAGAAGGLAAGAAGSRGGRDDEREVEGRNTNRERLLEGARDQKRERDPDRDQELGGDRHADRDRDRGVHDRDRADDRDDLGDRDRDFDRDRSGVLGHDADREAGGLPREQRLQQDADRVSGQDRGRDRGEGFEEGRSRSGGPRLRRYVTIEEETVTVPVRKEHIVVEDDGIEGQSARGRGGERIEGVEGDAEGRR